MSLIPVPGDRKSGNWRQSKNSASSWAAKSVQGQPKLHEPLLERKKKREKKNTTKQKSKQKLTVIPLLLHPHVNNVFDTLFFKEGLMNVLYFIFFIKK